MALLDSRITLRRSRRHCWDNTIETMPFMVQSSSTTGDNMVLHPKHISYYLLGILKYHASKAMRRPHPHSLKFPLSLLATPLTHPVHHHKKFPSPSCFCAALLCASGEHISSTAHNLLSFFPACVWFLWFFLYFLYHKNAKD